MKLDLRRFGDCKTPQLQAEEFVKATALAVKGLDVLRNRILVGTYVERTVSAGGIHLPDRRIDESRFQGKAGVILAMGPMAFQFDDPHVGVMPRVGEWIFYRSADTWEIGLGEGAPCRFIYDDMVVGRINDPNFIW